MYAQESFVISTICYKQIKIAITWLLSFRFRSDTNLDILCLDGILIVRKRGKVNYHFKQVAKFWPRWGLKHCASRALAQQENPTVQESKIKIQKSEKKKFLAREKCWPVGRLKRRSHQ